MTASAAVLEHGADTAVGDRVTRRAAEQRRVAAVRHEEPQQQRDGGGLLRVASKPANPERPAETGWCERVTRTGRSALYVIEPLKRGQ